jgi:NitT/TauT family transport system permease protein
MASTDTQPARGSATVDETLAGLDALSMQRAGRAGRWSRIWRKALPPLVAVAVALGSWQLLVVLNVKQEGALPSPAQVWETLHDEWTSGAIPTAIWNSVRRGGIGFSASVVIGTIIGLVVARVSLVRTAIGPTLTSLQILPSVAWVPAAIIWFGLSDATIYAVVLLGATPSIANGIVAGVDQIPPLYLRAGRVLGARRLSAVWHILLPAALPGYIAGLRQGWAFSWRSLMAAELITFSPEIGPGLGQFLDTGRQLSDMSWVMAGILVILAVGIAIELLIFAPVERRILRNRGLIATAAVRRAGE